MPSLAPKESKVEAEILVWRELDRGSGFVKALGRWYGKEGKGIGEGELRDLAGSYGLGLKTEKEDDWVEHSKDINEGRGDIIVLA